MACANRSAAFWSRYSLRNFTEFLFQSAHLLKILEDAVRFGFVDDADGETHMNQHVLSDFGFRSVGEVDVFANAAEVDLGLAEGYVAVVDDFDDPAWNGETHHGPPPRRQTRALLGAAPAGNGETHHGPPRRQKPRYLLTPTRP